MAAKKIGNKKNVLIVPPSTTAVIETAHRKHLCAENLNSALPLQEKHET
jgi:hypothetical protein